jgi:putative tricarboxylic transport membrane protein
MKLAVADLWIGLALMGFAAAYYAGALAIPDSLLSDEVGAAGLPKVLGLTLGACGALLAVRSQGFAPMRVRLDMSPQALGLVGVLIAYILVLPAVGYPLAMAALIAVAALLAGARLTPWLAVTAAAAGLGFWLIFVTLFGIAMPAGLISRWI